MSLVYWIGGTATLICLAVFGFLVWRYFATRKGFIGSGQDSGPGSG